jgi:hypothetical protein
MYIKGLKTREFVVGFLTVSSITACGLPTNEQSFVNQGEDVIEQKVQANTDLPKVTFVSLTSGSTLSASNLLFPVSGSGWTHTPGSPYHSKGSGFNGADDTYALDLNKNTPKFDSDKGTAVTPIAGGKIVTSYHLGGRSSGKSSWVLVEHSTPLKLDDGTVLNKWYSGYMHMNAIISNNNNVGTSTVLGYVSNQGATNNHLHFAIYSGKNTKGGLVSINIATKLKAFRNKYKVV